MHVIAVSAAELAGKALTGKGFVSQMRPHRYFVVPRESVDSIFAGLHQFLNFLVLEFQRILYVENFSTTVTAFIATFFTYVLIKYLPIWSLVLTCKSFSESFQFCLFINRLVATILAFTVPLAYLKNQEVVDEQIARAAELLNQQLNQAKEIGGKYANEYTAQAKAAAGNLTGRIQELAGGKKEQIKKPYRDEVPLKESDFPTAPTTVPADVIEPERQPLAETY